MMSAERPSFEPRGVSGRPFVAPAEGVSKIFENAVSTNSVPENGVQESWERVAIPKNSSTTKEPTARQIFWRDMYRTGNLSPYQKDRPKIDLKKVGEAWKDPQSQGVDSRIIAVDLALRGGADKEYNQLGPISRRFKRMAVMVGNVIPFTVFDIVTSIPGNLFLSGVEIFRKKHAALRAGNADSSEKSRIALLAGLMDGSRRGSEIANDKFTTAMGDWFVKKLTNEKGPWIREPSDKTGDFLDGAVGMYYEDTVNGPIIESVMHFLYEIPIFGALVEQGWTRLAKWQESSPFTKATGKAVFGGLGILIGTINKLNELEKKEILEKAGRGHEYKEPTSPSKVVADWVWKQTPWGKQA